MIFRLIASTQGVNSENIFGLDRPSADQVGSRHHSLGDTIGISSLVLSLAAWALYPTLSARIVALVIVVAGSIYLVYRSHVTRAWTRRTKHWVAPIMGCLLVAISCAQLVPQWRREHRAKLKSDPQNDTHVTATTASKQDPPVASL